ncbi:MAG: hypothetical protein RJB24_325 [Candidatus Parcubacteria bacterium]
MNIFLMRSFQNVLAGTILAANASLGVMPLDAKATPSPGEDWAYVADSETQPCIPRVSISDNVVDHTIRVRVVRGNTCPISSTVFLYIQDDVRPQPLRITGTRENLFSSTWIFRPGDARPGRYRVMGLNPMPGGIGDDEYISAYHLGIDQVITIGISSPTVQASLQPQPVSPPPPAVVAPPQQVVTTLDTESKQLLRTFDQWMRWFQVNIWPQLQPLIRAIEGIKIS